MIATAEELPKKRAGDMHRRNLPWWRKHFGHLKLADVTPAILVEHRGKLARETYIRARPESKRKTLKEGEQPRQFTRSPTTVNRYLAVLSHVFTIARREWHWVSHNPFLEVGRFREAAGRVRFLSDQERQRLLNEISKDPVLHTFVVLALATAARAGELLAVSWRDVDLKEGRLSLRMTKNAQPRTVWVQGEALRLLTEHGKVRRLGDDRVFLSHTGCRYRYEKVFSAACDVAKIEGFGFHDLRHSAATYLAREGATEQQLRAIGGWKSNVVGRYVHLAAQDAKAVLKRMNAKILDARTVKGDGTR